MWGAVSRGLGFFLFAGASGAKIYVFHRISQCVLPHGACPPRGVLEVASGSKGVKTIVFYCVFRVSGTPLGSDVWLVGGSKVVKTYMFYCVFCVSGRVPENG